MPTPHLSPREVVYRNRYYHVARVAADFGDFAKEYYVIEQGQRAGVVVRNGNTVLLVRQYRFLLDELAWEIPGGRVDEDETPESAAVRECLEETGIECRNLRPLLRFHVGLDITHNPTYLFYTDEFVDTGQRNLDPREVRELHWVPLPRTVEMIAQGSIVDSFSIIALLSYNTFIQRQGY